MNKLPVRVILSYLVIYIVWGSTYFFIKMAVETIPPFLVVGLRFFIGGALFVILSVVTGRLKGMPKGKEILSALFLGVFLLILGNGFVSWAERSVDSYLAALVIAATPFCVALFNGLFFRERLPYYRLGGMILGLSGVALLLYNGHSFLASFTPGVGLVVAGLCAWSFATSIGHKLDVHPNNLVSSGMQMLFAGAVALVLSAFIYPSAWKMLPEISGRSWIGLIYLTILGGVAFYCYSYLILHEPSIRIVSYSIVNPLIAVLLGLFIGGESPTPYLTAGLPLILLGLLFMLYGKELFKNLFVKKVREREDS